jgi:hypothetical protein
MSSTPDRSCDGSRLTVLLNAERQFADYAAGARASPAGSVRLGGLSRESTLRGGR